MTLWKRLDRYLRTLRAHKRLDRRVAELVAAHCRGPRRLDRRRRRRWRQTRPSLAAGTLMTAAIGPLRIALAEDEQDSREFFTQTLAGLGHQVVGAVATGRELLELACRTQPDLLITDIKMPDMDGIEAVTALTAIRPVPAILISAHDDAELIVRAGTGYIMAYLIKPVKEADLKTAIYLAILRFEHFQKLSREAATARQALEDRKIIERAKGIIMKRARTDEERAFRRLQKLGSDKNMKLVDVARTILTAEEAFQDI
jgi:two-component system, response regulator PdtaR